MGFAEPLALAFSGLVAVLVALYLWERTQKAVIVPSMILWQSLREDVIRSRRFRPDLFFFLQLLLLLALIAGLARPYLYGADYAESGRRYIVVLDTSASMQALEGRTSRFERARTAALELVAELKPMDEVMLVHAGAQPRVSLGFTRDHNEVRTALTEATASDAGGDLTLALEYAAAFRHRGEESAEIAVFTDLARDRLPEALRDRVRLVQFGETDDNVAIEALQVFQGRFQDYRSARVYVAVANHSHAVKHGVLSVSLEGRVIDRRGFTIGGRESAGFMIRQIPGPGRVRAALDGEDALTADNAALGWVHPAISPRILLASAGGPLTQDFHRVAASNGMSVTDAVPAQFDARMVDGFDLVVFDQYVPPEAPGANALYVFPPDSDAFPADGVAENVEILDWDATHPVLESVQPLSALPLQRARIVAAPEQSRTLLWARTARRAFPLAFVAEQSGRRTGFIGFDLGRERLLANDNLDLFLFVMNLIGWLLPGDTGVSVTRTGSVWASPDAAIEGSTVRDPRGATAALSSGNATIELPFAGEYDVRTGGRRHRVLANFFEPEESDIGRAARGPDVNASAMQASRSQRSDAARGRRPFSAGLYLAAIGLMLIEWVAWKLR